MNIDITAIERYLRLFALPVFLMLVGIMGMMLFSGPAPVRLWEWYRRELRGFDPFSVCR